MANKERRGAGRSKRGAPRGSRQPSPALDTAPSPSPASPIPEPPQPPLATGRIYTQCPLCKTAYRITVAQLRQGRGEAYCLECQASFDALQALAETADRTAAPPVSNQVPTLGRMEAAGISPRRDANPAPERTGAGVFADGIPEKKPETPDNQEPSSRAPATGRLAWRIGAACMAGLLALQWAWFAGPDLAQNERLRPWLENACDSLGCRLPLFHAPQRIKTVDHDLRPAPDGSEGYEFTLVLANQASLPQAFPTIRLSLEAYNGSPTAAREFRPEEYLPRSSPRLMPIGEPVEIRLLLARPDREIGGFSFELH